MGACRHWLQRPSHEVRGWKKSTWKFFESVFVEDGIRENSGLRPYPVGFRAVTEWKSWIDILCGSGKMLVVDRTRHNSWLNDVHWKILWWHFTLKCVSGKLGLRNHSRGTQSRFLFKTVSSAINSQYLDKNTSWMILGRFGACSIRHLVCDAFEPILARQTHLGIFWDTFRFEMCLKRLWG